MVRRTVQRSPGAALRGGLFVLLASLSLPAMAASGIKPRCGDAPIRPTDLTASTAVAAEPAADHERLTVLKAEGQTRRLAAVSELGGMIESDFDNDSTTVSPLEQQELRSSALADALERRRQGRLNSDSEDIETPNTAPAIDTALPGVGDAESLLYRREMYRTDI